MSVQLIFITYWRKLMHVEHFCLVMLPALHPFQPDHAITVNWTCIRAQPRVFDMRNYFWKTEC